MSTIRPLQSTGFEELFGLLNYVVEAPLQLQDYVLMGMGLRTGGEHVVNG